MKQPVSFKTAQLIVQKGISLGDIEWYYDLGNNNKLTFGYGSVYAIQQRYQNLAIPCYEQSHLQKFLRENKERDVIVFTMFQYKNQTTNPPSEKKIIDGFKGYDVAVNGQIVVKETNGYDTYEEALDAGLYDAMKTLEDK